MKTGYHCEKRCYSRQAPEFFQVVTRIRALRKGVHVLFGLAVEPSSGHRRQRCLHVT